MPDVVPVLERHHQLSIQQLAQWLEHTIGADRFQDHALRAIYQHRKFVAGWRAPTDFSGVTRDLDLLVDQEFPFSQPRVGLGGPAEFLVWPHIEEDGLLCLPARPSAHEAIDQAQTALRDAYELVSLNLVEPPLQHFQDEFLSYWARDLGTKGRPMTSILTPGGPSRKVAVWHGNVWNIVAENETSLKKWSENRFGPKQNAFKTESAALIWLPAPLLPAQFPKTASDIWALSREIQSGRDVLRELAAKTPQRVVVVLGAQSNNGPCFAGVTAPAPSAKFLGKKRDTIQKGFRPGHVPAEIASSRFWSTGSQVVRSEVSRADATWIHGRDRDSNQRKLNEAKVILIGAGSVGAPVANQLAMAGAGCLVIVDPEKLTAANTGRHPLGSKYIDRHKAEALAGELRENYPHHHFEFRRESWQQVNSQEPQLFEEATLIISATGDWNTEDALNTWHVDRGKAPPIIYGWTEEHACAGHGVLIRPEKYVCLACGLAPDGTPKFRATRWPGSMLNQEPGCGAQYQPYGPIELSHTVSLISELAIDALVSDEVDFPHRVWVCRLQFLQSSGGQWSQEWLAHFNKRTEGGFEIQREWPRDPACRVCGVRP